MDDRTVQDRVEEIENEWIDLADGCRIAARIWLPRKARQNPVPAILEYIPYRKRDFMRARDEPIHRYFAAHGYAAIRVDIRGSGDSDGILSDEYSPQELSDAVEIIDWIAAQPWCDGTVGMTGISWGGFNALQVAALRPEPLKAIITLCASDDRYADDAHYMGGCLLNENLQWGSILMAYGAYPPDPEIVGERWREMWRTRIEHLNPFPADWMANQTRDTYWKHGSVCEDYGAIDCAVYAIGGWADGYSNAIPRLMEHLSCPKKALIGPWAHLFPHEGVPGPAIGYLQEAIRWWDHWLKGVDTGIMDEPPLRVWMQEHVPPLPHYAERPGRWIAEEEWPSAHLRPKSLYLLPGRLAEDSAPPVVMAVSSPQTTGSRAGEWCAFGADGEMPLDQRADDGRSLTFESLPLDERLEILGAPVVSVEVALDRPQGMLAVRLNDIAPNGASTQVSYGLLNLSHRNGHESPEPMPPDAFQRIALQLNDIAHAFPPGHRIGVAISTSFWPMAWPAPAPFVASFRLGETCLTLPERAPRTEDAGLRPFEAPDSAPGSSPTKLLHQPFHKTMQADLTTGETVYTFQGDAGEIGGARLARIDAIGMEIGYTMRKRYSINETDPLSAKAELQQSTLMQRGGWSVRIDCRTCLTATATEYRFTAEIETFEGDAEFVKRQWDLAIPRNHS